MAVEATRETIRVLWFYEDTEEELEERWKMELDVLKEQPLVRCRDCKHNPVTAWFGCPMVGTKRRTDDDFCSFGERIEDAVH